MEQTNSTQGGSKFWTWLIIIAIPVAVLAYIVMSRSANTPQPGPMTMDNNSLSNNTVDEMDANMNGTSNETSDDNTSSEVASAYKDGTYTAVGDYVSPGGPEQVEVTLTIKDGVVTDSVFKHLAERPISLQMQENFAAGYKEYVIGKKLDEVEVGKVSGSSLTPKGFNDAVAKIKVEAKS